MLDIRAGLKRGVTFTRQRLVPILISLHKPKVVSTIHHGSQLYFLILIHMHIALDTLCRGEYAVRCIDRDHSVRNY